MALTSFWCAVKVRTGASLPISHTKIYHKEILQRELQLPTLHFLPVPSFPPEYLNKSTLKSEEQEAKRTSEHQSTSSVGAEWRRNCCLTWPVLASHTIAVVSTEPLSNICPFLLHFNEKMGPNHRKAKCLQ